MRNVDLLREAHMHPMAYIFGEKRLRWAGHVQWQDKDEATREILHMTVDGTKAEMATTGDEDIWQETT